MPVSGEVGSGRDVAGARGVGRGWRADWCRVGWAMLVCLSLGLGLGAPAQASLITLSYTGTSATTGEFSAILFITAPAAGATTTDISGSRNGVDVIGLSSYASADNAVLDLYPYVSFSGLSYETSDGTAYNLYLDGSQLFELSSLLNPGGFPSPDAPVATANIVEPVSIALLGTGLVATGLLRRRYRQR